MVQPVLIFDLDGTLVDSAPDLIAAMNHTLTAHDIPAIAYPTARSWAGLGARGALLKALEHHGMEAGKFPMEEMFDRFLDYYEAHICDKSQPFDGVAEALGQMRARGWALGVCTNKYQRYAEALLAALKLERFFDEVVGADRTPWRKPDPRHLTETLNIMSQSVDNCIFIGDSEADMETANAARVPMIAVDFGYSQISPEALGADVLVDHFDKIADAAIALLDR